MSDAKSSIIFIALSAVLLIGIGLLPKSGPVTAAVAATSTVVHVTQTSDPAPVKETSAGWTVTVDRY